MHAFYRGLGRFTVKFRWVILVVWILGTFGLVKAFPSLSSQVNNQNTAFLPTNSPDVRAAELAKPLLGRERAEAVVVVAVARHGVLKPTDLNVIQREILALRKLDGIARVQFAGEAPSHKAVLISATSNIAGLDPVRAKKLVYAVIGTFTRAGPHPAIAFYVTGQVADGVFQNAQSRSTGQSTQGLSILFIVVLLFLIFRSVLAPFVTLLPAALVLQASGSIIGEIASQHILKVSEVTQLLLIVIVLGAGTDYGLFLVYRVREGLRSGHDPKAAVAIAVERVGESITASAGTVILALLSLLLATFGIYHDLGVPLAIGIATMLLAGLTLLPALLAILGRAVFWPTRPRPGRAKFGWWGRVAGRIVSHPAPTLAIGLVFFGVLAAGLTWYSPSGFGGDQSAPKGTIAAKGDAIVKRYFLEASSNPTNLVLKLSRSAWQDPAQLQVVERKLASSGLFTTLNYALRPAGTPISPSQLQTLHARLGPPHHLSPLPPKKLGLPIQLYEEYRADGQYISKDGYIVQFAAGLKAGQPGGTAALHAVPAIRAALTSAAQAVHAKDWGAAGEAPALADISSTSDSDLVRIIPLAALAIALLLALVLRSLVAPLYLIASVVLSYLAALGLAAILFVKIGGQGGLTFLLPFLMFIFLLALGEDYNILVMTRIREEAHDHTLKEAVVRAIGASGPTITSAGLVLAGTFGVLAVAGSQGPGGGQIRAIGVGLALGILMDTFLVRTLLVPSTVVLLKRANWWPRHVEAGMGYPGTEQHRHWRLRRHSAAEPAKAEPAEGNGTNGSLERSPAPTPEPEGSRGS